MAETTRSGLKAFNTYSAPFVMKMRFYLPEGANGSKNSAHAKYICDKAVQDAESLIHAQYIGERKGSRGLFGPDGVVGLKDTQLYLKNHNGIVWRFILSLHEDDAKRMGHETKEDWEKIVRQSIPGAASAMGIALDNLKWVAAFHDAKGHPHVHLMAWENEPTIERGALDDQERKNVRRAFMNEFYGAERRQMMLERTLYRDAMRESAILAVGLRPRQITASTENERPIISRSVLSRENALDLNTMLTELRNQMPGTGRISLRLMPQETRETARNVSNWLMEQDGFRKMRDQYLECVRELTKHHTLNEDVIRNAEQRALDDLRDRVAQVVLRGAIAEAQGESARTDILETLSMSHAAWAMASVIAYVKQYKGEIDADDNKLAKTLGDKYEQWKNKEKLTMER